MPKFKNSNATFWVLFKQCGYLDNNLLYSKRLNLAWAINYRMSQQVLDGRILSENLKSGKIRIFNFQFLGSKNTSNWREICTAWLQSKQTFTIFFSPFDILRLFLNSCPKLVGSPAHCLKITQNVAFEIFNVGIFHQFLSC